MSKPKKSERVVSDLPLPLYALLKKRWMRDLKASRDGRPPSISSTVRDILAEALDQALPR